MPYRTIRMIAGFVAMALLTSTSCEEEEYKYPYSSPYIDPSDIPQEMATNVCFVNRSDSAVNVAYGFDMNDLSSFIWSYKVNPDDSVKLVFATIRLTQNDLNVIVSNADITDKMKPEQVIKKRLWTKWYELSGSQLWNMNFTIEYSK